MSPAPQRSASSVLLTADQFRQVEAFSEARSIPLDRAVEALINFGLAEQARREAELKTRLESFHSAPEGSEKDAAMNLLGEAIFGR